jgi:hypothetical protein
VSFRLLNSLMTFLLASGTAVHAQDTVQTRPPREQTEPSAGIGGIVTATHTGQAVMGVQVILKGTRHWVITDQNGSFQLTGLKPGRATVEFRHPNRAPLDYEVTLTPGEITRLAVKIDTRTVALPEVVVEGEETRAHPKMADFFARQQSNNGGYFITRKDIEKRQPRLMSDMLRRVPGLRIDCGSGACEVRAFNDARLITGSCPIQYFLDGAPFMGTIDEFPPDQIEGVEIYRGSASIPSEFNTGSSMCGVIAMWSRVPGQ